VVSRESIIGSDFTLGEEGSCDEGISKARLGPALLFWRLQRCWIRKCSDILILFSRVKGTDKIVKEPVRRKFLLHDIGWMIDVIPLNLRGLVVGGTALVATSVLVVDTMRSVRSGESLLTVEFVEIELEKSDCLASSSSRI
jgi:hypothetical protein